MDSKLKKILSGLEIEEAQRWGGNLMDRIAEIVASHNILPAPRTVPSALKMTPQEFMEAPLERFSQICEETSYRSVTSSLNFVASFHAKDSPEVKRRIATVRAFLKEWKAAQTAKTTQDQGSPSRPKGGKRRKSSGRNQRTSEA
jgi:hypothetical protein